MQGEKIPVELELLDVLHKKLHSIEIWKDELSQVFVDKSSKEILQVRKLSYMKDSAKNLLKC